MKNSMYSWLPGLKLLLTEDTQAQIPSNCLDVYKNYYVLKEIWFFVFE